MSNELTTTEKLTIAQALYKSVADVVSTKNPDSLRAEVDAEMLDAYRREGIKSRDLRINGEKVGTCSVRVKKAFTKERPVLTDMSAFKAWLEDNQEYAVGYALSQPDFVDWVIRQGELPSGYDLETIEFPEVAAGTTLKVDVKKVASSMGNELPNAVAGLLGGE